MDNREELSDVVSTLKDQIVKLKDQLNNLYQQTEMLFDLIHHLENTETQINPNPNQ